MGKRTYETPQVVALDQAVFKLTDEPVTIHDSLAVSHLRSLAPGIPELYLSAPRGQHQGASQLAEAAGVSVMSAFRFVEEFSKEDFLESGGAVLRLVRLRELLNRWMAASQRRVLEVPMRWVLHRGKTALWNAIRSCRSDESMAFANSADQLSSPRPRLSSRVV